MSFCYTKKDSQDSIESYESLAKTSSSQGKGSSGLPPSITPCLKSSSSNYLTTLEKDYESLQMAFFALTSHFAKVQFRLRQIIQAQPGERDRLLIELAAVAFRGIDEFEYDDLPRMNKDLVCLGNIRRRQGHLIDTLRCQMEYLSQSSDADHIDYESEERSAKIEEK